jgi:hypothetical protein
MSGHTAVNYRKATITANQPQSVTTFVGIRFDHGYFQWRKSSVPTSGIKVTRLTDGTNTVATTPTLNIAATTTADTGNNYFIVVSNPGAVSPANATVTVMLPHRIRR